MRLLASVVALAMLTGSVLAASNEIADAKINTFLRTWEDNATVTQAKVDELYAHRVNYYGRLMSREQVLEAKRTIVQKYPYRRYRVVPGTVTRHCSPGSCTIDAVMRWTVVGANGGTPASGATTVSLSIAPEENGTYKITAENGVPLARSR